MTQNLGRSLAEFVVAWAAFVGAAVLVISFLKGAARAD